MNSSIDSLNMWGARFLDFAVPMLWQSSLLIAVVFAADFLLRRKIRAAVRYSLWFVVFVKLVVPPTLALPTGAAWWLRGRPVPPAPPQHRIMAIQYSEAASDYVPPVVASTYVAPPPPRLSRDGWVLISAMAVSGFLAAWLILRWRHVVRCVRRTTAASVEISEMLAQARRQAGLQRKVALRVTSEAMSPAVCGLFKPVILLPQSLVDKLTASQLRAVLLHELIHLQRQDVWVNCVQTLLQIFYWWHPLLWLANARVRRVREEAVDDAVMCVLKSEAEIYAPTLLEVAKLAFSRPLASLGLVGILESRNALRHRIERLLNFATPRRAGVSVGSVICLAAFTALAVPMGEPPARTADTTATDDLGAEKLTPYHAKVNPEVFLRNIKARAGETMHTTNDDWNDILVSIMDGVGVDCTGPRAFTLDTATGELTSRNSAEVLNLVDEVVKELNLAGGERILNPQRGLMEANIEAQFYEVRPEDVAKLGLNAQSLHRDADLTPWWGLSSTEFTGAQQHLKELGIKPMTSPRIQTYNGIMASLFMGDGTNDVRLECVPYVRDGVVRLSALARTKGTYAPEGKTWPDVAGHTNCAIFSRLNIPDGDGAAMVAEPVGATKQLLILLKAKVVDPAAKAALKANAEKESKTFLEIGKLLYQLGKMDEAEEKFQHVLAIEPNNQAALYYLSLIKQARAQVDQNIPKLAQNVPGPDGPPLSSRTQARQKIYQKLNEITFDKVTFSDLQLSEVLETLTEQVKRRDPDQKGIEFSINRTPPKVAIDPSTGQPVIPLPDFDPGSVKINVNQRNVRLMDVLDAIEKSADHPIGYSLGERGIVFSFRFPPETPPVYNRTFKVDVKKFYEKFRTEGALTNGIGSTEDVQMAVINFFGGAGVDLRPPKSVFFGDRQGMLTVRATEEDLKRVEAALEAVNSSVTPVKAAVNPLQLQTRTFKLDVNTFFLSLQKIGVLPVATNGIVSTATTPSGQRTLQRVMSDSDASTFRTDVQNGLLDYFRGRGVDLQAPKSVFYNDRKATLTVRATEKELDTLEQLLNLLNSGVDPDSAKANESALIKGTLKVDPNAFLQGLIEAGVFTNRPPYTDSPELQRAVAEFLKMAGARLEAPKTISYNRKQGMLTVQATAIDFDFIGKVIAPFTKPLPEVTVKTRFVEADKEFLKTLSTNGVGVSPNSAQNRVLTEAQFKPILKMLQNRSHADLLNEGEVTTLSGMQANFQVVDVTTVVFSATNKTPPFETQTVPYGTFLDVISRVAADGYTIQLKVIPNVTEFLGYENVKNGKLLKAFDSTKTTVPVSRSRQTSMDTVVSDGYTLMLGDFGDEWVTIKPGGTSERKPFNDKSDKRLIIFITTTVINPSGNRVHGDNANAERKSVPATAVSYETK